ncbi:MAG: DUF333 domain-containing protein, partial [Nanoarchaeota archaeon]|nr:DUF333 domain-containing protein [Nanoarchaeota archaeon]
MILSFSVTAIPNPSAVYCNKLGYDYEIEKTPQGETGKCIVKPRVELKAWDFFKGKVGKQYSYCAQNGYDIETEKIDKGTYSIEYAVCVSKKTFLDKIKPLFGISVAEERISMHELMKEKGESLIDAKAYIMEQEEGKNIKDDKPEKPLNAISETKGIESGGAEGNGLGNPPIGDPHSLFDWRNYSNKNWMTPVKNQGDCGSCWAFSAVGAVEAKFNIDYNDPNLDYDLSEQQLVSDGDSCCSGGGCDDGCNGGSPITALGYTRDTGIADEDCFSYLGCHSWTSSPYNCDVEYPCNLCGDWQDRAAKITNYHKVTPNTTAAYKQALMDYGPLSIAIDSGEMFTYYFGGIYDQSDANLTGLDHAIVLVGWNDTGSYWIVKNSWGTGWGDSGYAKMNYGDIEYQDYVYAVEDTIRPLNKQARLQSYLISPTSSINVTKNEFFNFSTGVNCINGYCGDVNATLTLPLSQSQPTTCSEIWGGDCSEGPPESFDNTFDNCSSGLGGDHSIDEVYLDKSGLEFGEEIEVICNVIIKGLNCGEAYTNDRLYIYYRNSPTGTWEKKHYVSQVYSCYNYSVKFVPDNVEGEHQVRCITGWLIVEGECGSGGYYDNDDANFSVYDYNSDKGKIPMNTGSPFYTISQNPSNCTNMTNQSTCNQTWIVNATGEINSSWLFYTIYESNLPDVETNETGKINVTIVDTPANTYNLSDYYPLNQGDTWTYSTIRDGYNETEIVLINGTETFGSVDAVKMYFYYGYYGWEYDALQWAPEGLMDYKWVYDNGTEYEVYSTPIMNAPVEMSTGQTHQDFANYTGYEEGNVSPAWTGNETTILTLLGIENITVPAGTFEALKFTCTNNWFDDDGCYGTDSAVNWLAYKIGIIREIGNESEYCPGDDLDVWNYSMELINATVGGVSYQNDKQQITNNYNALETAFKAENITSFMYHVSPEYFDECENYSNFRDNIQHLFDNYHDLGIDLEILNITISDSFAFVIINRNWSGKRNSDGITEQDTESFLKEIWKKENNNWTMYGNQGRSQVSASTGHNVNPWNDNYFLWMSAKSECDDKELIAANVTGPGITTVTLGKGGEDYFSNFSTIKPNIGDVYTFHLLYNDSYTEEINDNIESLVESGPNITYPQHMSTITKLEPIFTWTNASSAVNNQGHYFIKVSNSSDAEIWHINLPLTETSVQYNINGVAEEPLERGKNYWFEVFINDVYENFAYQRIFFNVSSDI